MRIRLELRDKTFNSKDTLEDEATNRSWSYSAIGGCGEINLTLPRKRFEERTITGESNLRLYFRHPVTGVYTLVYQGLIVNKTPSIRGNSETISLSGHGYQEQLNRIYLPNITYTSQEASVIVK